MAAISKVTFLCLLACLNVNCDIRVKDVNFEIIQTNYDMSEAVAKTHQQMIPAFMGSVSKDLVGHIPVVGNVIGIILSESINAFNAANQESLLLKVINENSDRKIAKEEITNLKETIRTIHQNFKSFHSKSTYAQIQSMITVIRTYIMDILNILRSPETILRQYPELVFMPLSVLVQSIAVYEPLVKNLSPETLDFHFPCQMLDLITDYRSNDVFRRLTNIEHKSARSADRGTAEGQGRAIEVYPDTLYAASLVLQSNFSTFRYKENHEIIKHCEKTNVCRPTHNRPSVIIDELSQQCLAFFNGRKCPEQYMKALRHAVERKYDPLIKLMNELCPYKMQSERKLTGFGRLTIIFLDAFGEFLPDGSKCDLFDDCDLYINVKINGSWAYSTQTKPNARNAYFSEMYTTPIIFKTSLIKVTLWDEDNRFHNKDDSLFYLEGSARLFNKTGYLRVRREKNYMSWRAEWHAQYIDDDYKP